MYDVQATVGPVHILKPAFGSDLIKELNDFVHSQGINLAWFSGLGAVSRATIRYYDQPKQEWVDRARPAPQRRACWVTSLLDGNRSTLTSPSPQSRPLLRRSSGTQHYRVQH
jgi:predicted DNA-binding protein with PD1-like motif